MTGMDHDALRDAAGLYVLGALAGDERRAFDAHLATCAECQAEVRALGGVVRVLPYALPQVDPPPALRARVLAVAGGDASPAVVAEAATRVHRRQPSASSHAVELRSLLLLRRRSSTVAFLVSLLLRPGRDRGRRHARRYRYARKGDSRCNWCLIGPARPRNDRFVYSRRHEGDSMRKRLLEAASPCDAAVVQFR